MQLVAYYQYVPADYDEKGNHKHNGKLFLEQIDEWDKEFHQEHAPYYANHLFANYATMRLIDNTLELGDEASSGMDLIDGAIDIEANTEMEKYSEKYTIYALGSKLPGNPDDPIYLIRDEEMKNGDVILKYLPDEDGGDDLLNFPNDGPEIEEDELQNELSKLKVST